MMTPNGLNQAEKNRDYLGNLNSLVMEKKSKFFVALSYDALLDDRLKKSEVDLYCFVKTINDVMDGPCTYSQAYICGLLRMSPETMRKALNRLKELDLAWTRNIMKGGKLSHREIFTKNNLKPRCQNGDAFAIAKYTGGAGASAITARIEGEMKLSEKIIKGKSIPNNKRAVSPPKSKSIPKKTTGNKVSKINNKIKKENEAKYKKAWGELKEIIFRDDYPKFEPKSDGMLWDQNSYRNWRDFEVKPFVDYSKCKVGGKELIFCTDEELETAGLEKDHGHLIKDGTWEEYKLKRDELKALRS